MFDLENFEVYEIVNISAFILGLLFGAIAQKNQFCFFPRFSRGTGEIQKEISSKIPVRLKIL